MENITPSIKATETAIRNGEAQLGEYDVTRKTATCYAVIGKGEEGSVNIVSTLNNSCTCVYHEKQGTCKHQYMVHAYRMWNLAE
jgi:hypothetical protein